MWRESRTGTMNTGFCQRTPTSPQPIVMVFRTSPACTVRKGALLELGEDPFG